MITTHRTPEEVKRDVERLRTLIQSQREDLSDMEVLGRIRKLVDSTLPIVTDSANQYTSSFLAGFEAVETEAAEFLRKGGKKLEHCKDGVSNFFQRWKIDILKKVATENSILTFPTDFLENHNEENQVPLVQQDLEELETNLAKQLNPNHPEPATNLQNLIDFVSIKGLGLAASSQEATEKIIKLARDSGRSAAKQAIDAYWKNHVVITEQLAKLKELLDTTEN